MASKVDVQRYFVWMGKVDNEDMGAGQPPQRGFWCRGRPPPGAAAPPPCLDPLPQDATKKYLEELDAKLIQVQSELGDQLHKLPAEKYIWKCCFVPYDKLLSNGTFSYEVTKMGDTLDLRHQEQQDA
ncbi:hypothetical protein VPH35_036782 [Triticum aestivum]|uniref:Uncharacterized protein n=1 Tax=Aegilops tauschii TaxID=37682 RepID=M8CZK0_AEGTA